MHIPTQTKPVTRNPIAVTHARAGGSASGHGRGGVQPSIPLALIPALASALLPLLGGVAGST